MRVFIVLYGCAAKPELSDEIKGFVMGEADAAAYCKHMNEQAEDGYAYFYEEATALKLV